MNEEKRIIEKNNIKIRTAKTFTFIMILVSVIYLVCSSWNYQSTIYLDDYDNKTLNSISATISGNIDRISGKISFVVNEAIAKADIQEEIKEEKERIQKEIKKVQTEIKEKISAFTK